MAHCAQCACRGVADAISFRGQMQSVRSPLSSMEPTADDLSDEGAISWRSCDDLSDEGTGATAVAEAGRTASVGADAATRGGGW